MIGAVVVLLLCAAAMAMMFGAKTRARQLVLSSVFIALAAPFVETLWLTVRAISVPSGVIVLGVVMVLVVGATSCRGRRSRYGGVAQKPTSLKRRVEPGP